MKWSWLKKIRTEDVERALILCASAMVVALALRGNEEAPLANTDAQTDFPVVSVTQTAQETQETVVHFTDGQGYLVPVTCQVKKSEGIAKETLAKMVASSENDLFAARLGLKTTLPEGTQIDLDIANGKARVDMSKEALSCPDAESEALMVQSVVETLCRFDTVEEVSFLFDGQQRSKLTHGMDVSGAFTGGSINFEETDTLPTAGAQTVQLYFPSQSGRMLVPVSRTVYSDADATTVLLELLKGPRKDSGLLEALPENVGILSVKMENGVCTVNFTRDFIAAMEEDTDSQRLDAVTHTLKQLPGVKEIRFLVEGESYTPPERSRPTALNVSSEIISYYPGVIETD